MAFDILRAAEVARIAGEVAPWQRARRCNHRAWRKHDNGNPVWLANIGDATPPGNCGAIMRAT